MNLENKLKELISLCETRLNSIDEKISDLKGNCKSNLGSIENAVNDGFKKVFKELK